MADRSANHKGAPTRKLKKKKGASAPSTPEVVASAGMQQTIGDPNARLHYRSSVSPAKSVKRLPPSPHIHDYPEGLSLYERESRAAEAMLAAERKACKKRKPAPR